MLPFQARRLSTNGQINIPKEYLNALDATAGSSFKIMVEPSRKRLLLDLIE